MDVGFLSNVLMNESFLFTLIALAIVIWIVMRLAFGIDSIGESVIIAFLAILFLPSMLLGLASGSAFLLLLLLGAVMLSNYYCFSLATSVIVIIFVLFSALMIMPVF
jgi:hypothetical protein